MTHHARLNMIMLATIIAALIFLYFRPPTEQAQEFSISSLSSEAVQDVRLIKQHDEIVLSKTRGQWRILKPIQARADEKKIAEIILVHQAKAQQRFPLENLERFGLDRAYVQLYLNDEYFGFGSYVPITNQQYVANGEHVYVISPRYGLLFPAHAQDLASRQLLEAEEVPIKFESHQFIVELQQLNWHIRNLQSGKLPDEQTLEQWVKSWQTARAEHILQPHEMDGGFIELANIKISLQDDKNIAVKVLHNADQVVFMRSNEDVGYAFSNEAGQQLLTPFQ
ncbi:MAG: DUF4340 domain-containing protein [Nitrosomonas sp.]